MSMQLLPGINVTQSALDAERTRLNIIAQNIANAQNTRDVDGDAYKRRVVVFESVLDQTMGANASPSQVKIAKIAVDPTPGAQIYDPEHPHARENGMVEMPNVQMSREMIDLITATRAYEANLKVVSASRAMAERSLEIGRG